MANKLFSVLVLASIGLLPLISGCHAHAKVKVETAKAEPAPEPVKEEVKSPIVDNKIVLPGELEFDVNKATIKDTEQSRGILTSLAAIMKDNPKITKLRIEGHTDSSGSAPRNLKLSQDRAETVAKWLAAHEIERARLATVGLGQTKPIADNDTLEHRAQNRRTEFHLQEVEGKTVANDTAPADTKSKVIATK